MLAAGDYDLLRPVLEWASGFIPVLTARTKLLLPNGAGAGFWSTEMTNAFGLYQGQMWHGPPFTYDQCANASARPPNYPQWLSIGGWQRWDFGGNAMGPEVGLMALDLLLHTGNLSEAARFVPLATGTLDFFAGFYKNRSADGRVLIWPAQVLESWWCNWPGWADCPQNDMPTVAGATALAARLIKLPADSGLVSPAQRATYAALAAAIPPLPRNGGLYAPADVLSDVGPGHREVPELFAVHPFKLLTVGRAALDPTVDLSVARATWNATPNAHTNIGWYYGGIDAALLGLANESWAMAVERSKMPPDDGYRYDGFAPHLQDYQPSADHYANMQVTNIYPRALSVRAATAPA